MIDMVRSRVAAFAQPPPPNHIGVPFHTTLHCLVNEYKARRGRCDESDGKPHFFFTLLHVNMIHLWTMM